MNLIHSILIVDDDPVHNFLCRKIINRHGISREVICATNGSDGLNVLEDCIIRSVRPPEIILLDVYMPVMNGFVFLESFRKLDPKATAGIVPVMMSASPLEKILQDFKTADMPNFIVKPLTVEKMMAIIGSASLGKHLPSE